MGLSSWAKAGDCGGLDRGVFRMRGLMISGAYVLHAAVAGTTMHVRSRPGAGLTDNAGGPYPIFGPFQRFPLEGRAGTGAGGHGSARRSVVDRIDIAATMWELGPMRARIDRGLLNRQGNGGCGQGMDTLRKGERVPEQARRTDRSWKVWA